MYCKNCGNQIADNTRFCPNCGCEVSGFVENAQVNHTVFQEPNYMQGSMNAQMNQPITPNPNYMQNPMYNQELKSIKNLGTASIILAFFIPLAGLICGISGVNKSKSLLSGYPNDFQVESAKKTNKIGIVLSIIVWIISSFVMYGMMYS